MRSTAVQRAVIAAFVVPMFVACASSQQGSSSMASGTLSPSMIEMAPVTADESNMLHRMTDPNILGHLSMGDSVEVVMAQFAERRTRRDDIVSFARMMNVDHSTDMQAVRGLAQSTGLGMHTIVGELKMSHMGPLVDSVGPQISENTFDRNYILANVQMHQHMLAELQALQGVAQNAAVRDHITAMIPKIQAHLNRARDIAGKYNFGKKGLATP